MNWSIILTQYPKSLLNDPLYLVVLTFLERNGLATGENIAQQLGLEEQTLNRILVDLFRDRCIVYISNTVRPTDRGRLFIDRFGLQESVVEMLLDQLDIDDDARLPYREVIESYRKDSFAQYLNSVSSMNEYKQLCYTVAPEDKEASRVGQLTLLLRDLRNWYTHKHPSTSTLDSLQPHVRQIITFKASPETAWLTAAKELKTRDQSRHDFYFWDLHAYGSAQEPSEVDKKDVPVQWILLLYMDSFQANSARDEWFPNWSFDSVVTSLKETKEPKTWVQRWLAQLGINRTQSQRAKQETSGGLRGSSSWWKDAAPENLETRVLADLALASSLDDFAQKSGVSQDGARDVLKGIKNRCEQLLSGLADNEGLGEDKQHDLPSSTP